MKTTPAAPIPTRRRAATRGSARLGSLSVGEMQLAAFSTPQIKRILKVTSLEDDVLKALMLVKRLGPDVKEGKQREFNYIGKLLREVEPELMETLIQATKVGDHNTLLALAASKMQIAGDDDVETEETKYEEEEVSHEYINIATRWFDGLLNKDVKITNEVYSIQSVDFDRQELRKLVKRVHASQESRTISEVNEAEIAEVNDGELDAAIVAAKKSRVINHSRVINEFLSFTPHSPNFLILLFKMDP